MGAGAALPAVPADAGEGVPTAHAGAPIHAGVGQAAAVLGCKGVRDQVARREESALTRARQTQGPHPTAQPRQWGSPRAPPHTLAQIAGQPRDPHTSAQTAGQTRGPTARLRQWGSPRAPHLSPDSGAAPGPHPTPRLRQRGSPGAPHLGSDSGAAPGPPHPQCRCCPSSPGGRHSGRCPHCRSTCRRCCRCRHHTGTHLRAHGRSGGARSCGRRPGRQCSPRAAPGGRARRALT